MDRFIGGNASESFEEEIALAAPARRESMIFDGAHGDGSADALERMARGLVHDFNNALSPVLGYTELLLQDGQTSEKSRPFLDRIEQGALRAIAVLKQLELYYRKTQRNQLEEFSPADVISAWVDGGIDVAGAPLPATDTPVDVRLELDDSLRIHADREEFILLVAHLFANAVEASAPRQTVSIGLYRLGNAACLEIADDGVGMSPAILRHCLDPFQTAKSTVGAGLGLSICRGIVRRLRARLEFDSSLGEGTTVRVVLRLPATPIN